MSRMASMWSYEQLISVEDAAIRMRTRDKTTGALFDVLEQLDGEYDVGNKPIFITDAGSYYLVKVELK